MIGESPAKIAFLFFSDKNVLPFSNFSAENGSLYSCCPATELLVKFSQFNPNDPNCAIKYYFVIILITVIDYTVRNSWNTATANNLPSGLYYPGTGFNNSSKFLSANTSICFCHPVTELWLKFRSLWFRWNQMHYKILFRTYWLFSKYLLIYLLPCYNYYQ